MKKLFLLGLIGLFLSGCGTAYQKSEFFKHNTSFKNLEHLKYSIWGYQDTKQDDVKKTRKQQWWGESINTK